MAHRTHRMWLRQPERGRDGAPNDRIDLQKDWLDSINLLDKSLGIPSCTSTTHLPNPFDGMLEYETDTDYITVWDAVQQKYHKIYANAAQGIIHGSDIYTDQPAASSSDGEVGPFMPVTFYALPTRSYWAEYMFYMKAPTGTPPVKGNISLRLDAGETVDTSGALITWPIRAEIPWAAGTELLFRKIIPFYVTNPGLVTVGVFFEVLTAGSMQITANSTNLHGFLHVRDMGSG